MKCDNLPNHYKENYLIIFIDVEGYEELNVLNSLLETLEIIYFLCVELSYNFNRVGLENNANSVHDLLKKYNFEIVKCDSTGEKNYLFKGDHKQIFYVLYMNTKLNS